LVFQSVDLAGLWFGKRLHLWKSIAPVEVTLSRAPGSKKHRLKTEGRKNQSFFKIALSLEILAIQIETQFLCLTTSISLDNFD